MAVRLTKLQRYRERYLLERRAAYNLTHTVKALLVAIDLHAQDEDQLEEAVALARKMLQHYGRETS